MPWFEPFLEEEKKIIIEVEAELQKSILESNVVDLPINRGGTLHS